MAQQSSSNMDYSGHLQISTGKLQGGRPPTYYAQLYGCMLYYWAERPRSADTVPLARINLEDVDVSESSSPKLAWVVEGPHIKKPVTFIASADREKGEWIEKMRYPVLAHNVDMATQQQQDASDDDEDGATVIYSSEPNGRISLEDFVQVAVLGRGAFGDVLLVEKKGTGNHYAMKVMEKLKLSHGLNFKELPVERSILEKVRHPFIVRLHYAFQSEAYLYIVLDFLSGGELFFHLEKGPFDEDRAKFYTAEIALAIGYLHSQDIIYRDLKPENVVLDGDGHACLTDFGLAKANIGVGDTTSTYCGTPEYQAPEFLLGESHGRAVDWWSLGIMLYEMLLGIPPFYDENQNTHYLYELILEGDIVYSQSGRTISPEAQDLLARLLDRDPESRLKDIEEIKVHPFFAGIDFEKLYNRQLEPPFRPNPDALKNFDQEFTSLPVRPVESASQVGGGPQVVGFTYNADVDAVPNSSHQGHDHKATSNNSNNNRKNISSLANASVGSQESKNSRVSASSSLTRAPHLASKTTNVKPSPSSSSAASTSKKPCNNGKS